MEYADISATLTKLLRDAQGASQELENENILYPGIEWNTSSMNTWAWPTIANLQYGNRRVGGRTGSGDFLFRIETKLPYMKTHLYAREELGAAIANAIEKQNVEIKDYFSGGGTNSLGWIRIREGILSNSATPEDGIYWAILSFPFTFG